MVGSRRVQEGGSEEAGTLPIACVTAYWAPSPVPGSEWYP